jgi:hypothetical protein
MAATKPPQDLSGLVFQISQKIHFHLFNVVTGNCPKINLISLIQSLNTTVIIRLRALLFICNTPIIIYNILPQCHLTGIKTLVWLSSAKPYTLSVGFDIERATRASPGKKGAVQALPEGHPFPFPFHLFRTLLTYTHTQIYILHFWISFFFFLFFWLVTCFTGDEDTTLFEGGTWSVGLPNPPSHHMT